MGPTDREKSQDRLASAAYDELLALAQRCMTGERRHHTLQPTELVHEAWMRLARSQALPDADRTRFLSLAATAMRRILVDHARARSTERRSAERTVSLELELPGAEEDEGLRMHEIAALDTALVQLEARDARLGRIVELRFFGGLTVEETAASLDVSARTVKREWRLARAWLHDKLREDERGA